MRIEQNYYHFLMGLFHNYDVEQAVFRAESYYRIHYYVDDYFTVAFRKHCINNLKDSGLYFDVLIW